MYQVLDAVSSYPTHRRVKNMLFQYFTISFLQGSLNISEMGKLFWTIVWTTCRILVLAVRLSLLFSTGKRLGMVNRRGGWTLMKSLSWGSCPCCCTGLPRDSKWKPHWTCASILVPKGEDWNDTMLSRISCLQSVIGNICQESTLSVQAALPHGSSGPSFRKRLCSRSASVMYLECGPPSTQSRISMLTLQLRLFPWHKFFFNETQLPAWWI